MVSRIFPAVCTALPGCLPHHSWLQLWSKVFASCRARSCRAGDYISKQAPSEWFCRQGQPFLTLIIGGVSFERNQSDTDSMGSLSGILIPAAVLFFSYYFIGAIINYRRLSQFKGPPLASFSRFWLFWKECAGQLPKSQVAALEQYGTCSSHPKRCDSSTDARIGSPARIGHDLLVTDDADLIMRMNAPGSKWTRSGWYDAMRMDPRKDSVFSTRNEKLHAELKSKEAGGVSAIRKLSAMANL